MFSKIKKHKYKIILFMFILYDILCPSLIFLPYDTNEITIVSYQYWYQKENYNEEEAKKYVKENILKETNDKKIIEIYEKMKKDQNITITKNKETGKIYFFTNDGGYKSYLEIYRPQGTELELEEKIWILHPYKVGYGEYDEENNQLYLGVIRTCFNEGCFLEDWIEGPSSVNINFWRKINSLVNKEI